MPIPAGTRGQMETIFRAWEHDDLQAATGALEEVPEPFRQTWEYRFLRDVCRRTAFPALVRHLPGFVKIGPDGKTMAVLNVYTSDVANLAKWQWSLTVVDGRTQREWKAHQQRLQAASVMVRTSTEAANGLFSPIGPSPVPILLKELTIWNVETGKRNQWSVKGTGANSVPGRNSVPMASSWPRCVTTALWCWKLPLVRKAVSHQGVRRCRSAGLQPRWQTPCGGGVWDGAEDLQRRKW